MNLARSILFFVAILAVSGCTSAPMTPSARQEFIASAVEDSLSLGLVPVLIRNPSYIPVAKATAATLASFSGSTISADDIKAFVGKTGLPPDDAKTIVALVSAAWATYERRYQAPGAPTIRPDVTLFLNAVSRGILNAVAAVPR